MSSAWRGEGKREERGEFLGKRIGKIRGIGAFVR